MSNFTKQGVADLSKAFPDKPNPRVVKPEVYVNEEAITISDLIYDDSKKIRKTITDRFPEAILDGDRDYIHGERVSVEVRTTYLTWYKFLISAGLAELSLTFQLALHTEKQIHLVEQAMDEEKPGWRDRAKRKAR